MPEKKSSSKGSSFFFIAVLIPVIAVLVPLWQTYKVNDPLSYLKPNLMLFTNMRDQTREEWKKVLKFNEGVQEYPSHVPTIEAKDYTFERLRQATENWRYPAVVRGMFADSPAATKWPTADYLSSKIGDFIVPVVRNGVVNTLQNDRGLMTFREAYADIFEKEDSKMYMFFPVKSRFNFNHSDVGTMEALSEKINQVVLEDLQIDQRIWKGFGTKNHKGYYGSQLIIGKGSNTTEKTTGTGWHCAPGNNWFAQVRMSFAFLVIVNQPHTVWWRGL